MLGGPPGSGWHRYPIFSANRSAERCREIRPLRFTSLHFALQDFTLLDGTMDLLAELMWLALPDYDSQLKWI
jgi:hypothetical protein